MSSNDPLGASPRAQPLAKIRAFGKAERILIQKGDGADSSSLSQVRAANDERDETRRNLSLAAQTSGLPGANSQQRRFGAFKAAGTSSIPPSGPASFLGLPTLAGLDVSHSPLERQEMALKAWINGLLCHSEIIAGAVHPRVTARMHAQLRMAYTRDEALQAAIGRIENRWSISKQITAEVAETVLGGVRERAGIQRALAAYHPLWLRLAVEVATGATIPHSVMPSQLIKQYIIADQSPSAGHFGGLRSSDSWAAFGTAVAKRLLLVIVLLDRVGIYRPAETPWIFCRKGGCGVGSSAEVMQQTLGPLLREADVGRSLGRMGCRVSYVQSHRDDFDMKVDNLAVDLRDGLRLCRLADVLLDAQASASQVYAQARFPAVCRPDRLFNVQMALNALFSKSTSPNDIDVAAIVDGDRESSTCLLWRLVLRHQIPLLINSVDLDLEIDALGLRDECGTTRLGTALKTEAGPASVHLDALLRWVNAVARRYGAPVDAVLDGFGGMNFADGHLFCLLAHHYVGPATVPLARVGSGPDYAASNFALLRSAVLEPLGIPILLSYEERGNLDGRVVALFTALLCHCMLETNKEHRAALVIQRWWRKRNSGLLLKTESAGEHLHRWIAAAAVVQRCLRAWLVRRAVRAFADEHRAMVAAAVRIQRAWRARPERQRFLQLRAAAVGMQAAWRGELARRMAFEARLAPVMAAAALHRRELLVACVKEQARQAAATKIQRAWRTAIVRHRREQAQRDVAARIIQATWRMLNARVSFLRTMEAAVVLQAHVRGHLVRVEVRRTRHAVTVIQRSVKEYLRRRQERAVERTKKFMADLARAMSEFAIRTAAATKIQATVRGYLARVEAHRRVQERAEREAWAQDVLSRWIPVFRDRLWFVQAQKAARILQTAWRTHLDRHSVAATIIQKSVRSFLAVRQLQRMKMAVVDVQRAWRGHLIRKSHPHAAVLIQIRARLHVAAHDGDNTNRSLGYITRAALDSIHSVATSSGRAWSSLLPALEDARGCLSASYSCCELAVESQVVPVLLQTVVPNTVRDKSLEGVCRAALACVSTICSCRRSADKVFDRAVKDGTITGLVEVLATVRDKEGLFFAAVETLKAMVVSDTRRSQAFAASCPEAVTRLVGVTRLLGHKHASASTYLSKLESEKGSDASARQATRALFAVKKQIETLVSVLTAVGVCTEDKGDPPKGRRLSVGEKGVLMKKGAPDSQGMPRGKNTIVRTVLAELTNAPRR